MVFRSKSKHKASIRQAIEDGRTQDVEKLLRRRRWTGSQTKGKSLNKPYNFEGKRTTMLIRAVRLGDTKAAIMLMNQGADPHAPIIRGEAVDPVVTAIEYGRIDILRHMVQSRKWNLTKKTYLYYQKYGVFPPEYLEKVVQADPARISHSTRLHIFKLLLAAHAAVLPAHYYISDYLVKNIITNIKRDLTFVDILYECILVMQKDTYNWKFVVKMGNLTELIFLFTWRVANGPEAPDNREPRLSNSRRREPRESDLTKLKYIVTYFMSKTGDTLRGIRPNVSLGGEPLGDTFVTWVVRNFDDMRRRIPTLRSKGRRYSIYVYLMRLLHLLISLGASPSEKNSKGYTPVQIVLDSLADDRERYARLYDQKKGYAKTRYALYASLLKMLGFKVKPGDDPITMERPSHPFIIGRNVTDSTAHHQYNRNTMFRMLQNFNPKSPMTRRPYQIHDTHPLSMILPKKNRPRSPRK